MTDTTRTTARPAPAGRLGDRLRLLRVAAGLTQTELAGDRFSKEYVSQIERGKTRPTRETVEWLATRLDVDPAFLSSGISTDERGRVEALLARADALTEAYRYRDAIDAYEGAREAVAATNSVELDVRARTGEAWARMQEGDIRTALELLAYARAVTEGSIFSDVDRADVLFRMGACRFQLGSVSTATTLLGEALALAERSGQPCDGLCSDIHHWRSRCHRRLRDFEAAREDAERALELAQGVDDRRKTADAYFQASLAAERTGHWVLSRSYAERAKRLFQELDDERTVGRLLNNLGGLSLLLGKPQQAIEQLKASLAVALEVDSRPDAGRAVNGIATVHLHLGEWEQAAEHARKALTLLDGRDDFVGEVGQAHVHLGRALMELGRLDEAEQSFHAAERAFEQLSSPSHRAAAWIARGDLAGRRGDAAEAARLYRNAAATLQDLRF
ncbi:MAG TPA: tetratricopeptide repeat protein [Gaiellaceae bacterium]|jgi:tetratricopeptide (TPR) repeat protein|nr:tetratricopeptide repeat protein [Gaiellaceae bacterium]